MKKDAIREEAAKKKLDAWLVENIPDSPYIYVDVQGDLFRTEAFDLTPKACIELALPI